MCVCVSVCRLFLNDILVLTIGFNKFNYVFLINTGEHSFLVKHFADIVNYEVDGFLEKNKDTVFEEQVRNNRFLYFIYLMWLNLSHHYFMNFTCILINR